MHSHPASLHHVVIVRPFSKWGIDFMHCNPTSARGYHYIIIIVDYFTKWVEAMPTFANYSDIVHPRVFSEGDLVLVYDQDRATFRVGKFEPLWYGPYIIKSVLSKVPYMLVDMEGNELAEPHNALYLK